MTKTTIIGEAQRTLDNAKRAFDKSRDAVSGELSRLNEGEARPFNHCELWNDIYYAFPNSNQTKGYLAKISKFVAKYPEAGQGLNTLGAAVEAAAKAVADAKAGLEAAQAQVKADREAKAADKGDQNLIAAMAGPRNDYRARCITHLFSQVAEITVKLAEHGNKVDVAYPFPDRSIRSRNQSIQMTETRRFVNMFFQYSDASTRLTVVRRGDNTTVIESMADKMVANHFDGYIYKLSHKIGKPVATAKHEGSIWNNCVLTVTCKDGETQVWHTQCIFNVSVLGKVFNQWPTRRQA